MSGSPFLRRSLAAVLLLALTVIGSPALAADSIPGGEVAAIAVVPATSVADFASGSHAGTVVGEVDYSAAGGQLRLSATLEDLFLVAELDPMWTVTQPAGGFVPVIADGVFDLQERDDDSFGVSAVESQATFAAGVVCEMRAAIFPGSAFTNLGFISSTTSPDQWLYFSTRGTGDGLVPTIMTSTRTATVGATNVPTTVSLGEFHVFRIVWTPGAAEFWVDDVLVDSRTGLDIDLPQRFGMYKSAGSDSPCLVDWVRITPYDEAAGTYTSAVQDAGDADRQWTRLTWEGAEPAATVAGFATRTGATAEPDTTWSTWSDVDGGTITSPAGRYLQYRASFTTTDPLVSPVVDAVQLEYTYLDITPPSIVSVLPAAGVEQIPCQSAVTATFDEPVDPATVSIISFTLSVFGGDPVPAAVGLDESGTTATLTPTVPMTCATTYEARLTTDIADLDGNHLPTDHAWTFTTVPPDLEPPVVVAAVPADGAAAVLPGRAVTVEFDEPLDPTTVTAASFTVAPLDGVTVTASVTYDPQTRRATLTPAADLALGTLHEVRLTTAITDAAGNGLPADRTWTFTTRLDPITVQVATTAADFAAGAAVGVAVAEIDSSATAGQLRLAGRLEDRFDHPDLDPQWHTTRPGDYAPVIAGGLLDVQERDDENYELSAIESYETWGPGVMLEARAMFVPGSEFIDVGFDATTVGNNQYAWFSTAGTGGENGSQTLYARVREYDHTTVAIETSASFNQWHVFKIIWTHGQVDFFVDGVLEATHTDVRITAPMHAAFYKSRESDTPFYIDWIRVTPYASTSGEYVSPVFDGGAEPNAWLDLQWSGTTPVGTDVAFATRTGESAAPDSTWSAWSDVVGNDITSPAARYVQYRSILTTSDPLTSPTVDAVYLAHGLPGDRTAPRVIACSPDDGAVDVPLQASVCATFDEPIDPATLDGEAFTLAPVGGQPVDAVVTYDPDTRTVALVPEAELAENTVYVASLHGQVRDVAGNLLAENHEWTFTTEYVTVGAPDLPAATALLPNYPNPFNPATTVRFDLARSQRVWIRLYGIDGRLVRTLVEGELPAGRHTRIWDGRDAGGAMAPTGVYVLRLATEEGVQTRKVTMLK